MSFCRYDISGAHWEPWLLRRHLWMTGNPFVPIFNPVTEKEEML